MVSRKIKRWTQQYLDGSISRRDEQRLKERMSVDPALKAFVDEMEQLDKDLGRAASEQPEVDFTEFIMQAIKKYENDVGADAKVTQQHQEADPWKRFIDRVFPYPHWNVAFAFMAGLVIGVVILSIFNPPRRSQPFSDMETIGSMTHEDAREILVLPVTLPSIQLTIRASRLPQDFTQLILEVTSQKTSLINLTYSNTDFQVWSLRTVDTKPMDRIMAGYDSVEIENHDKNTYMILLKKQTDIEEEIGIAIYVDGNLEFNEYMKI